MKNKNILNLVITIILVIIVMVIIKKISVNENNKTEKNETKIEEFKETTQFKVSSITCKPGNEVDIDIEMINDSDFVAANFELLYDKSKMEYMEYNKQEIMNNSAMSIVNNDENTGKVLIGYVGNPENKNNVVKAGKILSITFKINKELNDLDIKPEFKCTTLKKSDGTDILSEIEQSIIYVKK